MDKKGSNKRLEKLVNRVLDAGAEDITEIGLELTHMVIQKTKGWVANKYSKTKSKSEDNVKFKLEDLELSIKKSNEIVDIGMKKRKLLLDGQC